MTPRRRFPRIGVLGGSFDPVHVGHLILAETAIDHLRLEELILVPARQPAHKRRRRLAPVADRLAMLRLAVRGNPKLTISRIEADRPGVAFTYRTLETLTARRPARWFFLMGEDSLREFGSWREPGRILEMARLAVVPRPPEGRRKAISGPSGLRAALRRRVVTVPMPPVGISASDIRARIRRRASVRYWVPDAVLAYLNRHGLYRDARTGRT